jgi:UDP-N-acetylglucosamine/UDP-N-acetylgalactosamine diphosphorylase
VIVQPPDESSIRRRVAEAGQEHVFRFWNELPEEGQRRLLGQLAAVDFEELGRLVDQHITHSRPHELPPNLEPAPFIPIPRTEDQWAERRRVSDLGESLLAGGKVAAMVVAGGQGTRLGFDGPKGAFPIGPVSGRSLFAIFADTLHAARRTFGAPIPWYIMTSPANNRETQDFFEAHNCFDLPCTEVKFFAQGVMPAVDLKGRLILAARDELAWNPDGHGGSLRALAAGGMLADMAARGVEYISYFQVDNPLVPALDPVFLGYHAQASSDLSSKVVRKREPKEKLGVFGTSGGKHYVIEYFDVPDAMGAERAADGSLRFAAGNVAIHILSRRFVERLTAGGRFALPFHRATKKIPYVDETGRQVTPSEPNGVKLESFIFDALPMAERTVVLEVDRRQEFSPVKNASGEDSPDSARADMIRLAAKTMEQAGVRVPRSPQGEPAFKIEINPLAARDPEELKVLVARLNLHNVASDLYLGPEVL